MSKLAATLVASCLRIRPDDNVTIFFYPHNTAMAEDIATECFKAGADVLLDLYTDAFYTSYMKYLSVESLKQPSAYCRGLGELSTAQFWVGGASDPSMFRRFPPEKMAAADEGEAAAHVPIAKSRKVRSLLVGPAMVTRARAKVYGFPFVPWRRMMQEASAVSPSKLSRDGKRVAARLEAADQVRITAENGTDLELSVKGRRGTVYDGVVDDEDIARGDVDASVPAGSVMVLPVETSASGTAVLDVPQAWAGRTVRRVRWEFRDGRVAAFSGDAAALSLRKQWDLASGDKDVIAALTIGLNPRARLGFLSSDIVRGTVTISIGGNEWVGGSNKSGFSYGQTVANPTITIDGEELVRNGRLGAR